MPNVLNFIAFQLVWFVVILSAAKGMILVGLLATLLFAVLQLFVSRYRQSDLKLLGLGFVAGMMLDSIWLNMGWIDYASSNTLGFAPLWIGCLWLNFMLTLNHSMSWMHSRLKMVAVMTLFAAPLSYFAGSKLGAVSLVEPAYAVPALSISWALLVPMLMCLARLWRQQETEVRHAVV